MRGKHGLPLLGYADWNDTVNLPVGSESVFTACLYGRALQEMILLYTELKDTRAVNQYRAWYAEMKEIVNRIAWDGQWYVAYFDAGGNPIGSHANTSGKIFAYPQAWAVIAGFAEGERAERALKSVEEMLDTQNGIKLSAPGYTRYDPVIGGISTYPPGAKENGGIFLHVNPWVIFAETMLSHGQRAYECYSRINPAGKNDRIENYEAEPYVYPQNILGDEHPQFGMARNSWLSGTAAWMDLVGTRYILGVRPEYEGIRIDPCVPSDWREFSMVRILRDAEYHIRVRNPKGVCRGVASMTLNGMIIRGDTIPMQPSGVYEIEVVMG
jgi:cellobiose phosphorylase